MGDTENLRNPSTKTQPYYFSHSYPLPIAISVLLAQPACYGTRSVRNKLFHPFHVVAFLDYSHLIRNLYRYSKPYTPRLIVPHPDPFHHIHHLPALHYPAHTAYTLQTYTVSNSLSDTLEPNPYYCCLSKLNHAFAVRPNHPVWPYSRLVSPR